MAKRWRFTKEKEPEVDKEGYHYTECGLCTIKLISGYKIDKPRHGGAVSFDDIDGLHRAIGMFLVSFKEELRGEELRFLRHELSMSKETLASVLGVDEETVDGWEHRVFKITKSADAMLRTLYRYRIAELENKNNEKVLSFAYDKEQGKWEKV